MQLKIPTLFLFVVMSFIGHAALAQNNYQLPNIIPPSPTAVAFSRYGDIPVDISTGVPRIEIPLYTIKTARFEIPLSLSYHASGIKVEDISTFVGLGWVLNGMGLVSRTVVDKADDLAFEKVQYNSKAAYRAAVLTATTRSAKTRLAAELQADFVERDKSSDRFNFQLPGKGGGAFRYDFITSECVVTPYQPVSISKTENTEGKIAEFKIKDEAGNVYTFNKAYATNQSYQRLDNSQIVYEANTSWYLTSIVSADGTDEITYEYHPFENAASIVNYNHSVQWKTAYPCPGNVPSGGAGTPGGPIDPGIDYHFTHDSYSLWTNTTREPLLKKITSATAEIEFEYASNRYDIADSQYRLSSIRISDRISGYKIREIVFENDSYFGGIFSNYDLDGNLMQDPVTDRSVRLKLSGITVKGKGDVVDQRYTFSYHNDTSMDPFLPPYHTPDYIRHRKPVFARDFWGYYNGKVGNEGLIPSEFLPCDPSYTISCTTIHGGNRRPDHHYAKAYLIKSIQYPTGGQTVFEFEPNTLGTTVGGFRIQRIVNSPLTSSSEGQTTKTYEYVLGKTVTIAEENFSYEQLGFYHWANVHCGDPGDWGVIPTIVYAASSIHTQSSGFTSSVLSTGTPVVYTKVNVYNGNSEQNNGKTEYIYTAPDQDLSNVIDEHEIIYAHRLLADQLLDNGSYQPQLKYKRIYKIVDNAETLVSEQVNTYEYVREDDVHSAGVQVIKIASEFVNDPLRDGSNAFYQYDIPEAFQDNIGYMGYINTFVYADAKALGKVLMLTKSEEKQFSGAEAITVTTKYVYDNPLHLQPTEQITYTSDGDVLRTVYKYPSDFSAADPACAEMINRNILTPVVKKESYKGATHIESVKTNFAIQGNLIVPVSVQSTVGSNPTETRLRYHQYDESGNVLSVSADQDVNYSYVWGYNRTYPIAQVVNADAKDIFHTSFEDGQGQVASPGGKTGKKIFNGTFTRTLTGLTNGPYVFSYWQKSGSTWVLQSSIVNVTGSAFSISITGEIDEVRFYPAGAQMTTYTYGPLIGVTSQMDANGNITTYEYDAANRLKMIRDNNKNILEHTEYKYKQ